MSLVASLALVDGFIHPGLAAGALLAAVPLLIHLLNRQRHKPLRWAAMRFVLAAQRRTRRRVQMENLLLLLLRMGAVAALAFAVARPFAGTQGALSGLVERRRDVAIVIDGSASTGYGQEVETVFERIRSRARELVLELDGGRGDRARIVLAGAWPRLLSWTGPEQALAMIDSLSEPTDERLDLPAALAEVRDFALEEAAGTGKSAVELRLLTDLQRNSFLAEVEGSTDADAGAGQGAHAPGLVELLDELGALDVELVVEDLGPREITAPNVGIAALGTLTPIAGPGAPVDLRVEVANFGPSPRSGVRVWLEVDGERRPSQFVDLPARGRGELLFQIEFQTPGDHAVVARVDGDRLAADDARVQILRVPRPASVLVVNGSPAPDIERDAAGMLVAVLEPPDEGELGWRPSSPFLVTERSPLDLDAGEVALEEHDLLWLANVPSLAPRTVQRIEERVARGAALVMSMGDKVQAELYDERFFRADESGLLPAELARVVAVPSRGSRPYRVASFDEEHPALAFFADPRWKAVLTGMPIYQFFSSRPLESARVLARLDDELSSPLLIERAYDRGKTFLWTTSIDPSWTAIPQFAECLVPLVHELVRYAARGEGAPRNVAPGTTVVAEFDSFPRSPELVRPEGQRVPLEGEVSEMEHGRWRLAPIESAATQRAGLYAVATQGAGELVFAVQLDAREGDLDRAAPAELESLHPALRVLASGDEQRRGDENGGPARGELWRWLAGLALLALVLEALWAGWLAHKRRIA